MDRLTALKVFRQVIELGSFAAAARQMGLSPAAVSKNIGELEAHLGVRLINRTTRQLSRTEAGFQYYTSVVRILDDLDDADATVGPSQRRPRGLLRVAAPTTLTLVRLSAAIPQFLDRHPELSVELHTESWRIDLVEEGFDIAIRASDVLDDSGSVARKLMTMQQSVFAASSYLRERGRPAHPRDLVRHDCLMFSLSRHSDQWEFRKESEVERVSVSGRFRASSGLLIRDALKAGRGLSLLPRIYVNDDVQEGALETVLDDWTAPESSVYAVYPSRRHVPAKVRAFLDFLVEELSS